jgi:ferrous iron transport protein A
MYKVNRVGFAGWLNWVSATVRIWKLFNRAALVCSRCPDAAFVSVAMKVCAFSFGPSLDPTPWITMLTLDQLKQGDRATIVALSGESALLQRLLELGVFDGEEVEVIALAPFGDPIEIRCGDSRLSLRRREAASIQVHPLPAP